MRNFVKLTGIIALVAVIGFTMTACGEKEEEGGTTTGGGGGDISWPGTWLQIEDANGGSPAAPALKFVLNADGTVGADSVFFENLAGPGKVTGAGSSWSHDNIGMGTGPMLSVNGYGYIYDKISATKIKITGNTAGETPINGVYEKQ